MRLPLWAAVVALAAVLQRAVADCSSPVEDAVFIPLVVYFFVTIALGGGVAAYFVIQYQLLQAGGAKSSAESSSSRSLAVEHDADGGGGGDGAHRESWQISYHELHFGRRIGVGSVGEVYAGTYRGRPVAIKKLLGTWFKDEDMVARFKAEINLMQQMNHVNVLFFIGAVLDKDAGNICLVTELCERGTLEELLASPERISWLRRLKLARAIALGMDYLHSKAGIIQRDLKASNLLVTRDYDVKIADFGLSRTNAPGRMQTYCGTPAYMAPEIIRQQEYTEKCDVFSFGIILWELLTRQEPYAGEGTGLGLAFAVANEGWRPHIPAYCPMEWASLLSRAWAEKPDDRPSFEEIQRELLTVIRAFEKALQSPAEAAAAAAAAPAATHAKPPPTAALPWVRSSGLVFVHRRQQHGGREEREDHEAASDSGGPVH